MSYKTKFWNFLKISEVMGVAMLLIYWKAKFPKFLESENFQNFVRLILWTFVINISRYLQKFTKIEIFEFLKIFIKTCSALDCEIFQNFNFLFGIFQKITALTFLIA